MTETNIMFMPIILIFKKEKHQWMCIKMMELKFLQQRGSLFSNPYLLPPFLCGGTFLQNLAPTWTIFMLTANYSCDSKSASLLHFTLKRICLKGSLNYLLNALCCYFLLNCLWQVGKGKEITRTERKGNGWKTKTTGNSCR